MISTKMRSGWWSAILARASKPLSARMPWPPAGMRNISALRRMVLLSSMTITRTPVRFLESATRFPRFNSAALGKANTASTTTESPGPHAAPHPSLYASQPRFTRSSGYSFYSTKTTANPDLLKPFRRGVSKLDHFEVVLAGAALGAAPSGRNIGPARARNDAVFRPAFGLVVDEAACEATPGFVR